MGCLTKKLVSLDLIKPPRFVAENVHYETLMGSQAYGVSSDSSDSDVYGFCIPPRDVVFPHLAGVVPGWDQNVPTFNDFQQHHIDLPNERKSYDLTIYSIVRYFRLCADGNPNMVDSLFTPAHCILFMTPVGQRVREQRKLFLSKKCWHTFKGYAFAQMSKIRTRTDPKSEARQKSIREHGYDVKYAYHLVRLLNEVEQILLEGDLDLLRGNDQLKAIRKGDWPLDAVFAHFDERTKTLEKLYPESNAVPHGPPEEALKELLLECLEHHYGSLAKVVERPNREKVMLEKIRQVLDGEL